jgi:hypothetical protein
MKALDEDLRTRKTSAALTREEQRTTIDRDEAGATGRRDEECARIEQESRERLAADGADALQLAAAQKDFERCQSRLNEAIEAVTKDEEAVSRFRRDPRFVSELGYFEREDLTEAAFHQPGATREFLNLTKALKDRLEQVKRRRSKRRLADRLDEIAKHCASLPVLDRRSPEDMLYDEHGLPRE